MFCRNCGQPMDDMAAFCTHCGAGKGTGSAYCPNCGSTVDPNAVVCVKCGVALGSMGYQNHQNQGNYNPYQQNLKSADHTKYAGMNLDYAV